MDQDEGQRDAPTSAAADKKQLRAAVRATRASSDPTARDALGPAWAERTADLVDATASHTVAVYLSYGTEPPTGPLVEALTARGVRVLVPVLLEDRDLDWAEHDRPDVPLGQDEIAAADLVVLPALLVGRDGVRLGQGGGSYDRALRRVRTGTPLVALVHDDELIDAGAVPAEPHDHPVTHVVTPTRTVRTRHGDNPPLPIDPDTPTEEPGPGVRRFDLDVALAVAVGGALGSAARWWLNESVQHDGAGFPWSTFIENTSGALLLAFVVVILVERWSTHRYARPFLAVGVLGGYTTFSTYVADARGLVDGGHAGTALLYLVLTIALGLVATVIGLLAGRAVVERRRA